MPSIFSRKKIMANLVRLPFHSEATFAFTEVEFMTYFTGFLGKRTYLK